MRGRSIRLYLFIEIPLGLPLSGVLEPRWSIDHRGVRLLEIDEHPVRHKRHLFIIVILRPGLRLYRIVVVRFPGIEHTMEKTLPQFSALVIDFSDHRKKEILI